ncbi:MAG: RIP metalloprotease RseP [Amylibacter sp.]|tara:strand:+ start:77647 stop:79002 length:1356 start_codon:yes stop_codon:yes gene_type:complete
MMELLASIPIIGGTISLVIPFLIVISIVVFIHEYGHYIVGRWCGIHAEVFSVGMGRPIFSKIDKNGTKWQISLIPLGGYVKFLGDINASSTSSKNITETVGKYEKLRYFSGAKLHHRFLTVAAGPLANFILSIIIFSFIIFWSGKPSEEPIIGTIHSTIEQNFDLQVGDLIESIHGQKIDNFSDFNTFLTMKNAPQSMKYKIIRNNKQLLVDGPFPLLAIVGSVMPVSPASQAGLKTNDLIVSFDKLPIVSFNQLRIIIFASEPAEREMTVIRNGKKISLKIFPRVREFQSGNGALSKEVSIGVSSGIAFTPTIKTISIVESIKFGALKTLQIIRGSIESISLIFTGQISVKNLQGPIGIAHVSSDIAKSGVIDFISLIAIISTSIGFLNLLPLPVLDGGHLLSFAYEAISRRKPNELFIHYSALLAISALLTLMVFVSFNDIIRMVLFWK